MKAIFALVACLVLPFGILNAETTTKKEAKDVIALQIGNKSLTLKDLQASHKEKKLKVYVADAKQDMELVGFDLVDLLNTELGKDWQKADGILVTALDGYKSDLSVKKLLKYKPLLSYRFTNNKKFMINNDDQNEKNIDLGPYMIIWDNLKFPELKRAGAYDWPYQVASMETIQYSSHYAKAFPFKNENAKVTGGFEAFKAYCMECHAVGGQGGQKGPALWPYPAFYKGGEKAFTKYIINPQAVKPGSTMGRLNPELTDSEKEDIAGKIYAYLEALNKIKPSK